MRETSLIFTISRLLHMSTSACRRLMDSNTAYAAKAARLEPFCFRTNGPVCFLKPNNRKEPAIILLPNSMLTRLINPVHLVKCNLVPS